MSHPKIYNYMVVVWNSQDLSDAHVMKTNRFCGKVMLFKEREDAKKEALARGYQNCETVLALHD
jgi:hypothetical protein